MKVRCFESWDHKRKRLEGWHKWFAWRPVRVTDNDCRWLETLERRGVRDFGEWAWMYRLPKKALVPPQSTGTA